MPSMLILFGEQPLPEGMAATLIRGYLARWESQIVTVEIYEIDTRGTVSFYLQVAHQGRLVADAGYHGVGAYEAALRAARESWPSLATEAHAGT